jgi:amino acid adenylation domain-containing protein
VDKRNAGNIYSYFEDSARAFPDNNALEIGDAKFSYSLLEKMVNGLSIELINLSVPSGQNIVLFTANSAATYVGMLSILSTGCCYVPISNKYPVSRNLNILNSSEPEVVITDFNCIDLLLEMRAQSEKYFHILVMHINETEDISSSLINQPKVKMVNTNLDTVVDFKPRQLKDSDLAYILFTSGSTGTPKGVKVSHGNIRSFIEHMSAKYQLNSSDRFAQMNEVTFDLSVLPIYCCWKCGGCLCVPLETDLFLPINFIQQQRITIWTSVPSVINMMRRYGRLKESMFENIRYSFFCGEALTSQAASSWQTAAHNSKVLNLYGPTEGTVAITEYEWNQEVSPSESVNNIVPLGAEFDGQLVRVLTEELKVASHYEIGEICLSGSQITRGYFKREQETAAQFVRLPQFNSEIWYKTGDLGFTDDSGIMHYQGRKDSQAKILGHRIELGEIDSKVSEVTQSDLVVSIPWPIVDGTANGIVTFVHNEKDISVESIITHCSKTLPKYMIPSQIIFVKEIPYNTNGKVDRKKLYELLDE